MNRPLTLAGVAPVLVNLGCRTNAAELDELGDLLADAENVVVVNSCTVTGAADRDTRKAVARARREHPGAALVLAGCHVDAHPEQSLGADLLVPNRMKAAPLQLPAPPPPGERRSRYVLKVQDGCDNRCTFCIVWQARGRSMSRVAAYLEMRAAAAAAAGYREIALTGIDLGSYRGGLAQLVRRLLDAAPGVRIRLSSIDPSHVDEAVAALFTLDRVCPHLHLPLQSGSDAVLSRMGRRYGVEGFRSAANLVKAARPDVAITGDVMVGFPGEDDVDFARTLELIEETGFMGLHVFRYSPRPRTAAARRAGIPAQVAKARSQAAIDLGHRLGASYRSGFAGRRLDVIWDRAQGGIMRGMSERYITVTAAATGRQAGQLESVVYSGVDDA